MKSMAEIMARVNSEVSASRFVRIAAGDDPDAQKGRDALTEKTVTRMMGLNAMARKLGCSRGHLSLVIHGQRKSGRMEKRLRKLGFEVKEEAAI